MYLDSGKKPEYSERASADTGKNVNSTQKGLSQMVDSNPEPYCCEATAWKMLAKIFLSILSNILKDMLISLSTTF